MKKPKVIVLCGSTKYVQIMAVVGWLLERDEGAIVMGLHLLPWWYPNCPPDHLAEHENVKEQLDDLHMRKIDLADEVFIVNEDHYIGNSTTREIEYAQSRNIPLRWYTDDPIQERIQSMISGAIKNVPYGDVPIRKLVEKMQYKLDLNKDKECAVMNPDGKGRDWKGCSHNWLLRRLRDETKELQEAIDSGDTEQIGNECADVANFAMMILDNTDREL